jgi:hypothetical protein
VSWSRRFDDPIVPGDPGAAGQPSGVAQERRAFDRQEGARPVRLRRTLLAIAALALLPAPADAQVGNDPAVAACEATILITVPPANYRRVAAVVDRNVVSINYQASTKLKPQTARCAFTPEPGKGWSFDSSNSPEATACIQHGKRVAAMIRAETAVNVERERARSQACLKVLQEAQRKAAPMVLVASDLITKKAYPIAAETTALRQP